MNYYIITFGCQMNKSDSERIASVLENSGYKPVKADLSDDFVGRRRLRWPKAEALAKADLIVVNMCSVRQSAVDRVYGLIQKLKKLKTKKQGIKTILTGCVLKEDRKKFGKIFDLILDIKNLSNWPKTLCHNSYDRTLYDNYLEIQPKYQYKPIAFIPISNGCNNFCSYCVVPYVRGSLACRNHDEILKEVKNVIKKGFREIWLLGQNVNDYTSRIISESKANNKRIEKFASYLLPISFLLARKNDVNFAKLIKMINDIPGDFKFFFTSPHPKDFSDELINTLTNSEKFGKYLNLPLQSGDNKILRRMNRNYTVKEYKNLVKKIREKIPGIKLSTDVIVGFPEETKKQFQNTVKLFKEIKFNNAYIAKYSPRPGTAAWQLKDSITLPEKKKREKILRKLIKN